MPLQATSGAASYDAFGGGVAVLPKYIEDYFSTYLTTGTSSTLIVNNGIDLAGKGGLVWQKGRNSVVGATSNTLFDTARGVNQILQTNSTSAQINAAGTLTSFNSNGFEIGANNNLYISGQTGVNWVWAKAPKFFDVVTYTGDGNNPKVLSHSLGSIPACMIVKSTSAADNWYVYHTSLGATKYINLDTTSAAATNAGPWNNTAPTSTQFTIGSWLNQVGVTYVVYLFAHNAGGFGLTGTDNVISCGSFTTDGSGNATVNLGYEPQWLLVKSSSRAAGSSWLILDSMRGWVNNGSASDDANLRPNVSDAENLNDLGFPTATGFQYSNFASETWIYIAIRRGPMKVPTVGTSVFAPVARTGTGSATTQTAGFPVDLFIPKTRNGGTPFTWSDRLRGDVFLLSSNSQAENNPAYTTFDNQTGVNLTSFFYNNNAASEPYVNYNFRRAPSFFDEVCYTGTGSTAAISHNLAVVPELIIAKKRASGSDWSVWSGSILGDTAALILNTTASTNATYFNSGSSPTSTLFYTGLQAGFNATTYVAYLFATCAGVSKVFSFTGNGSSQTINCGFTSGARWVMIKRTDSTGDWYVWDSARGIVAGNDPHLSLNSTAAEVTTDDSVDTDSTGFIVNQLSATNVNVTSATYIGIAIA